MIILDGKAVTFFDKLPTIVSPGTILGTSGADYTYFVFQTPIEKAVFLDIRLSELERQTVSLVYMPHLLIDHKPYFDIVLKENCYYEIYVFGPNDKLINGCLISTKKVATPNGISFEAAKLFTLIQLNAYGEIKRGKFATVKVRSTDFGNGTNRIVWFIFDLQENIARPHYVWVNHEGGVRFSHNYTWQDFRQFFINS